MLMESFPLCKGTQGKDPASIWFGHFCVKIQILGLMQPSSDLEEPILGMKTNLPRLAETDRPGVLDDVHQPLYKTTQVFLFPGSVTQDRNSLMLKPPVVSQINSNYLGSFLRSTWGFNKTILCSMLEEASGFWTLPALVLGAMALLGSLIIISLSSLACWGCESSTPPRIYQASNSPLSFM